MKDSSSSSISKNSFSNNSSKKNFSINEFDALEIPNNKPFDEINKNLNNLTKEDIDLDKYYENFYN